MDAASAPSDKARGRTNEGNGEFADLRFEDFLMIIQSSTIADSENYQFTVFTRS